MEVREIKITKNWSQYYIVSLNIWVSEGALEVIADELDAIPVVIETTHAEGYYEQELKKAIILKNKYEIKQ